ncbi:UNVERIFIED_CONTAM: hypothetical protein Sradi_1796500 [Sesamum radiatum]|uniref:NHL domain-containing protein n=1 Tax=Sesamum radiatum TaxID=300843 RepID=A0AAW2TUK0_SESRA
MAFKMGENVSVLLFTLLLFIGGVYSVSAPSSPARIVNGLFSNAYSKLMKWVLSLKASTSSAISGRPMMKFESGYNVETVFDGSKLGIEPYSIEVLPDGNLLILDSANSKSTRYHPLCPCETVDFQMLLDLESYQLRMFYLFEGAKCLTVLLPLKFKCQQLHYRDIKMVEERVGIGDNGDSRAKLVSGSADGYSGHVDGRLREARMNHPKGLTVDDRGNIYIADTDNMAIRKINGTGVSTIAGGKRGHGGQNVDGPSEDTKFSSDFDVVYIGSSCSLLVIDRGNKAIREIQLHYDDCAYQYGSGFPLGAAVLIAAGFFGYMLALLQRRVGSIPSSQDESVVVLGDDGPPNLATRNSTPRRTYDFMSEDSEKVQHLRQSQALYSGWEGDFSQQQKMKKQHYRY